jgi:hypothetical protein
MFAPRSMGPQQSQQSQDDRLDAARTLMGVSPSSVAESNGSLQLFGGRELKGPGGQPAASIWESSNAPRRPRSNSAGLDALALLATKEQASMESFPPQMDPALQESMPLVASAVSSSSSDDDSETMPPPPPRMVTARRRSVSNPEGMEKWVPRNQNRLHFVLPASILEEELAEASAAMKAKQEELKNENYRIDTIVEEEEEILDQDELLRRARSRLLEDLSESNLSGEKGELTLPHSLAKYKAVSWCIGNVWLD